MDTQIYAMIEAVHDQPGATVLALAGGARLLDWLTQVPGASRTLLEATVPYAHEAFDAYVEGPVKQYASEAAARRLAGRSLNRALTLRGGPSAAAAPLVGLGVAAALVTDRPRRGTHRVHVAAWQAGRVVSRSLVMEKEARSRPEEEEVVARLALNTLTDALGISGNVAVPLRGDETVTQKTDNHVAALQRLQAGNTDFVGIYADGTLRLRGIKPQLLLCGSFNPLHAGHLALAAAAMAREEKPLAFEITMRNADKPALAAAEVSGRLAQFAGRWPVYVTRAATFLEKARLFPDTAFVIGFDTAERILQPRFYGDDPVALDAALAEIGALGGRFLVAGRQGADGRFRPPATLDVPAAHQHLFDALPAFRYDISSTALRSARDGA